MRAPEPRAPGSRKPQRGCRAGGDGEKPPTRTAAPEHAPGHEQRRARGAAAQHRAGNAAGPPDAPGAGGGGGPPQARLLRGRPSPGPGHRRRTPSGDEGGASGPGPGARRGGGTEARSTDTARRAATSTARGPGGAARAPLCGAAQQKRRYHKRTDEHEADAAARGGEPVARVPPPGLPPEPGNDYAAPLRRISGVVCSFDMRRSTADYRPRVASCMPLRMPLWHRGLRPRSYGPLGHKAQQQEAAAKPPPSAAGQGATRSVYNRFRVGCSGALSQELPRSGKGTASAHAPHRRPRRRIMCRRGRDTGCRTSAYLILGHYSVRVAR